MISQDLATPLTNNKQIDKFDKTEFILRQEKPDIIDQKIHMMTQPKSSKKAFKTVSYLLGNFSQMANYLYKPVQRTQ